jgi:choline kinase
MSRFTQNIKRSKIETSVVILAAGVGEKTKSSEPRALLKVGNKSLIEYQIGLVNNSFDNPDLIVVLGVDSNKVIKKLNNSIRIVENQLYDKTNSFDSLRLAVNNSNRDNLLFFHGDLYFNVDTLQEIGYKKSFILIDTKQRMKDKEVGVTLHNDEATILSYGLDTKWCQIAFFTGLELELLRSICVKTKPEYKNMFTFEAINKVIDMGGSFICLEPKSMSLMEIDYIRDLRDENFNC